MRLSSVASHFKAISLLSILMVVAAAGLLLVPNGRGTAEPALGGTLLRASQAPDFRLTDQFGRATTLTDFRGHVVVLTFLEAHCHETCPLIAGKVRQALRTLGRSGRQVAVLAISVDPEGDTVAAVRRFSRAHGMLHRWRYLMGSRAQLSRVWRAYYVYAAPKGASPSLRQAHTGATYLIDDQGREQALLTGNPDELILVRDLQILAGLPVTSVPSRTPAPESEHPAPDFALSDLAGKPVTLRSFRGKVVLVNFWATWCPPCRTEMPMLARWYQERRGQGLVILGVDQQEGAGNIRAFVRRLHIPYPIAMDESGTVSARYNVVGLPTSFLIDRDGTIRDVHVGILSSTFLSQRITSLLDTKTHE